MKLHRMKLYRILIFLSCALLASITHQGFAQTNQTNKGINLSVHSFTGIIEYYHTIKQFKIIQNNLEEIIVEYIVDNEDTFDASVINEIKDKFISLTQNCLNITFRKVEQIKPTKSGKPQIIEFNL